ncbi:class F sortase [Demequina mangrovi]|uniref:Sortase family protein n=1 Tax=Demequina mangrovi TaxID=1043493 RepID=A0A1H6WB59_9MICO|nr:class F sortase [Demequina mangrovi]SEJ12926.1 Sortase family protein [Demequina mangrovi]
MNRPLAAAVAALAVMAVASCAPVTEAPTANDPASAPSGASVQREVAAAGGAAAEPRAMSVPRVVPDVPVASASIDTLATPPDPSGVRLARLGVDMRVAPVGLDAEGGMELPDSAAVAGWFRLGGNPAGGPRGDLNVVLAAHVDDSEIGTGPFAALREARAGDRVVVGLEDGGSAVYVVDRVEQTSKREVDLDRVFGAPEGALVLVTCGGRWDADVRHYEDNVLVWAYPEDA